MLLFVKHYIQLKIYENISLLTFRNFYKQLDNIFTVLLPNTNPGVRRAVRATKLLQ